MALFVALSALSIVSPSVFVNYDLAHTVSRGTGVTTPHSTGVLTEIGLATGMGTLISSQVGRNLGSTDPNLPSEWRRLETTWTKDFHGHNMTLRLGDTSTRASLWVRNMFFGGVQLLAISVLGEYLSKVFEESKGRPKFIRRSVIYRGKHLHSAQEIENFKKDLK